MLSIVVILPGARGRTTWTHSTPQEAVGTDHGPTDTANNADAYFTRLVGLAPIFERLVDKSTYAMAPIFHPTLTIIFYS